MPNSSIRHARKDGTTMFSILSLNILESLDSHMISILESIGIKTIADLLHYKYIYQAQILVNFANGLVSHDFDTSTYLDNGLQNTNRLDIPKLPLSALKGIGPTLETTWSDEFNINNLQELSQFAPYLEATSYLTPDDEVFNEPASAPEDLMPKILGGTHSSVKFNSFVLYEDLLIFGNLQIPKTVDFADGAISQIFSQQKDTRLSIGYIAGFKQKWINKGTHLGEIIHTLALAPGESRNMSTIEWYRRQSSSRDESTIVDEQLSSNLVHSRALNEVTKATAREHQSGMTSMSSNNSTTSESKTSGFGGSLGVGATVPVKGVDVNADLGLSGSVGKSKVTSDSSQQGVIISSSSGSRDILGSVMQNINDSTVQNSSSARSLYSTVVVSDTQQESEQTLTRNVTNYNHMHALNIVSYEVVQKYGIETKMEDYNTVMYLPFSPINFDLKIIKQYWYILKDYLKVADPSLFERFDTFLKGGVINQGFTNDENELTIENLKIITTKNSPQDYRTRMINWRYRDLPIVNHMFTYFQNPSDSYFENFATLRGLHEINTSFNLADFDEILVKIGGIPGPHEMLLNPNVSINLSFNLLFKIKDNLTEEVIELSKLYTKSISYHDVEANRQNSGWSHFSVTNEIINDIKNEINNLTAVDDSSLVQELEEYFNRRKYFFTRLILNNIESEALTDLFRKLTLGITPNNRPFTDYVNPIPIAISDNYLILETKNKHVGSIDDQIWKSINQMVECEVKTGLDNKVNDEVFLPTAGVFAEAILGRANGSEFIDLRRFWNWQDSPIPNSAPTINPINTGSRDGGIAAGLDPNVPVGTLNVINPAPFQNPTSLDSALSAVQNGGMFRDMSKSEQLASSMNNLSELAKETAKQAATLSGDARKEALAAAVKMGQQVADTVDKESKSANLPKTPTEKGGALNELDKMDGNKDSQKEDVLGLQGSENKAETELSDEEENDKVESMTAEEFGNSDIIKANQPNLSSSISEPSIFNDIFQNLA